MKVYISCPVNVPKHVLQDTIDKVKAEGGKQVIAWDRDNPKQYQDTWVRHCDVFVIIIPKNRFKDKIDNLPAGCKQEILRARSLNKKVILSYKNMNGDTNLYEISPKCLDRGFIEGMGGSTPALHKHIISSLASQGDVNPCVKMPVAKTETYKVEHKEQQYTYDRRILLLF